MTRRSPRILWLLATLALAAPAWAQQGALTIPRNLQQLTDRADYIVRGSVASAHVEKHPQYQGLHTVVVTLRVRETLKGATRPTVTFRQYVWDIRGRTGDTGYRKGDDLLMLMIAPNAHGLSSPAGMDQGRFLIQRDAGGRELAANGHGNARLFDGMPRATLKDGSALTGASRQLLQSHQTGPIEIGRLSRLIREIVRASP